MPEKPLEVCLEATGQRPGYFTLRFNSSQYPVTLNPVADVTFSDWLRRLRPVLVGHNDPSGELTSEALLRNVGTWLWQALLPESAPTQHRDALTQALRSGRSPLLLALPESLAELPWELLYDPKQSADKGFLARRRPLMRLIPSDMPVPTLQPPLRVLLLISSPPSLREDSCVDVESERAAVEQATRDMREAGLLHLLVEDIVTLERVQDVLIRFDPHIVHYIGHGGYDEQSGGMLLWEDKLGNVSEISAARLAEILYPQNVCAVVLHACETGRSNARTDARGVAEALVKEGIPAVLAQQASFAYTSSQQTSKTWYTALTARRGFAQALFEVRRALSFADHPDWAVPILQGTAASLVPMLDASAPPGPRDPLLSSQGAVADLPTPTGIFVGRHCELRALRLMLENMPGSGPVLALITGPGGVGKSTLAAQAVTRYGGKYKAVLTLSCLGYQSIDIFLQRMAEFLKRRGAPGFLEQTLPDPQLSTTAKIEEAVVALNQAGPFLLVVDNLESARNADQTLHDESLLLLLQKLLTNLHGGRVLIIGRYVVKDLLPNGKFATHLLRLDLDDLTPYETNQLLTRHPTLAHLGETVRQTLIDEFGGLPYVYDLLSSYAASQSLDLLIHDVQGRITEERKQHTAEKWKEVRQQVVEFAAIEATVNRLSEPSRTLLARLGVLLRPFPLAAIEQGLGGKHAQWQPLLDWSLLRYDPLERTYHLHSITRHYAEDLLDEQDHKLAQAQLAAWYEQYARDESHNLADYLEAHRLLRASGKVRQAGELVLQLAEPLTRFGLYPLIGQLCRAILYDIGTGDDLLVATTLHNLGNITRQQENHEEALRLYQQSLGIWERLGDRSGQAATLHQLGIIAQGRGDYQQARRLYQQSREIYEQLGDRSGQASTLGQLGIIALEQGDYWQAQRLLQQSLEIYGQLDNRSGQATTLYNLGNIAQEQGDYQQARQLYQQSLEIHEQLGDQDRRAAILHRLGNIAQEQGDYQQARQLYQQSLEIHEQLGNQHGRAGILHNLGNIAQHQGDYQQVRQLYQQSLEIYERLDDQRGQAGVLHSLGSLARLQGNYQQARQLYQQSLEIAEQLGSQRARSDSLCELGMIARDLGDYEGAKRLYQQSLKIAERLSYQKGRANILHQLGDVALLQKDYEKARQLYQQGLEIREQLGDQSGQGGSLHQLGIIVQLQGDYQEAQQLYQQSMEIAEWLGSQHGQATSLHSLGSIARLQGDYQQAQRLYQQSLEIWERLGDQSGHAITLGELGMLAYQQEDFEKALTYTLQAYILFNSLQSPSRDIARRMIIRIRSHMDEATFTAYWQTIAGGHPLLTLPEDSTPAIEDLPRVVSSAVLQRTTEQCQQFATALIEAQGQLPPEEASRGRFFGCLAAVLRGETPEIASLEAPFTDLWQEFQDMLSAPLGEQKQQEEKKHD